ncbi:hypothetical protein GCM10020295_74150 [Streptomyces cinereospinus]
MFVTFKKAFPSYVGVAALACAAIAADGYDLGIYGAAAPDLLQYSDWALNPSQVGAIASATVLGMCFGAVTAGVLADRIGVRRMFMACIAWFSVAMIVSAVAPPPPHHAGNRPVRRRPGPGRSRAYGSGTDGVHRPARPPALPERSGPFGAGYRGASSPP